MALTNRILVVAMCAGQVGNLLPHVVVPAVMAQDLMPAWQLNASEAGLMASSYALGYMVAVPVLATLTDRIDARRILLVGSAVSGLATIAFGLFAQGLLSASLIWALAGIGFAGAYMPGLKALTDRLGPGDISRSITFYTATFSLGVGLSFLVSQLVAQHMGWRIAFFVTGLGPLVMIGACLGLAPVRPTPSGAALLDFRPVVRNRAAMGYILGYGAHCFELYAMRTWLVAFWTYVAARSAGAALEPVTVSFVAAILAMPASVLGNEAAIRFGRRRLIVVVMLTSAAVAVLLGALAGAAPAVLLALLLIYSVTVPADSGALTSGMAGSANPAFRGATMAAHSAVGFGLSAFGGWAVGVALDLGGGPASQSGWLLGFLVMGAAALVGPLVLWWSARGARSQG